MTPPPPTLVVDHMPLPLCAAHLEVVVPSGAPADVVMVKNVGEKDSFISVQEGRLSCQVSVHDNV